MKKLDLVEVAPNSNPPVCKIINFGKYRYQLQKKEKQARKKQKIIVVKEIKITPMIDEHDYQTKAKHIKEFLNEGDRVKVTMRFRGREITHQELGRKIFDRLANETAHLGEIDQEPRLERNIMQMIIGSKR